MTLTQLKYILALAQTRHFAEAAKNCHVTQPTLSMQIQKLEDWLQVKIFDRSTSPVKITEFGKKIIEQAGHIIKEASLLEELVQQQRGVIRGEFRLGVIPTIAPYLVPLFLNEFSEAFPDVNLKIEELQTHNILDLLKKDHLDAGIMATPIQEKNIINHILYYEPFYAFISPLHPLAAQKQVFEDDLNSKDAWLLEEGHCFRGQMLKICKKDIHTEFRNVSFASGSLETVKNMVKSTPSFTLLPYLAVESLGDYDRSLVKRFSGVNPTREISLVTSNKLSKISILDSLKDIILSSIPEKMINEKGVVIPLD